MSERERYNHKIGKLNKKYKRYAGYEEEARKEYGEDLEDDELERDGVLGTYGLFEEDEDSLLVQGLVVVLPVLILLLQR